MPFEGCFTMKSVIGIQIKKRREELGLTQEELANILGYKSRSSINKIELGKNDITQHKVVAFAKALNTTPAYLMGWDEESQKKNDILSDIILRLRSDDNFMKVVKDLYDSTDEQINVIKSLLITFKQ